jgi:hypothetical protein
LAKRHIVKKMKRTSLQSRNLICNSESLSGPTAPPCSSSPISLFSPYQNSHLRANGRTLSNPRRVSIGGPDTEIIKPRSEVIESMKPGRDTCVRDADLKRMRNGIFSESNLLSKSCASEAEIWLKANLLLCQFERNALAVTGQIEPYSPLLCH